MLLLLSIIATLSVNGQYYKQHYIAPAKWSYFSNANEIVIATNSTGTAHIVLKKSDGTVITNLTATKGSPAVYRPTPAPSTAPAYTNNTVLNGAGLDITSDLPISVNVRNVASDASGMPMPEVNYLKGNASLFSFGNAGIGTQFRLGYYRGGTGINNQFYTVLAIDNGTVVKLNGSTIVTLNAGQSYVFNAAMGDLLETSKGSVANSGAMIDAPAGCGDGVFDQIVPVPVLSNDYMIVRGAGNTTAEQSTIIATDPGTNVTITTFNATGAFVSTNSFTLTNAGSFSTVANGVSGAAYSAIRVQSDKNIIIYSGSAAGCEVDMSVIAPIGACSGSPLVETYKFTHYNGSTLPYFGYVLLNSATEIVYVNGVNLESLGGVRRQMGTTGWYLIDFTNSQLGNPNVIQITCNIKVTVAMIQQGGGFSMAGFFSAFSERPEKPTVSFSSGGSCVKENATLTTPSGFGPYQWYLNGTAISGATSNTYLATATGSYSVSATVACGTVIQSLPITITLCDVIAAVNDGPSTFSASTGGTTSSVLLNDVFNSTPATTSNVIVSGLDVPFGFTLNSDGTITVPSGATAGTYELIYKITQIGNPLVSDFATATIIVTPSTDLLITKTVDNSTPNVGSNIIFTITATNNGPSIASGVVVSDLLPTGYSYVGSTPSTGSYNSLTGVWTIGSLNSGSNATINITAWVEATGTYANTATISGNETDPTPLNNTATSTPVPVAQTDLAVTKTVDNATPNVGSNVTFTITASNNGPSGATGVSVADALPSGYTLVSSTPSVGTYTAPNWTVGSLANAGTATLTVVATVNATGTYANTATISGNETDPTPLNNTATSTPVPVPQTDLAVTKTVDNATPNVGSNVTFTITASNNGPSGATGVSVADALPSGYTLVSATPSVGTYTAPNWTVGSLANVGTATLTVVATVVATGTYANTATISGNETDPTPLNNTATSTPVPVPQTDLAVTKTVDNATPNVGSNVTFTITASNNGPSGATGVSVADALPSGYTLVSATPSVGTYTAPNWTIGSLANAGTATLTVVATVNATGTYANTATISGNETDPTPLNNTATSTPVPVPQTDLAVTKTVDNATPNVGSNVTFTITASNNGPSGATGVSVADALPSGYTLVSATPSVGTYTAPNWTVGSLANAGTATLTVVATVNATGTYANTATITGNETDPVSLNNTATSTPVPVAQTDLAVTKTVDNATPNVGSNVTFTITASNNGPSGATGVSVADALPSGYTLVSATPSVGTYTAPNWTVGSLANAGTATLTVVATVNATGTYANTATITGNETDPVSLNNTATSTPVPVAQTDLAVTKTVSNATPNVGSNVTFTITASNNGPSGATGVSVADALPSGYTLVSATPSVGTYTAPNWTIGSLANAGTATLTVVATVNATGIYGNTATISGNETDPVSLNNTATSTPVPVAQTDLAVTKTVDNATPNVGSNVTFTITASNNGPSGATGVSVADALPSGYTLVSATPSVGTYTAPNWTIGSLANAGTATLTVIATVVATGTYANTATISGNETDPTPLNNTATSTPVPVPQTDLAVTKTVDNTTPNVGSNVTFTITASNSGPSGATGVSVADALPSGYTLVSATPSVGTYTAPNWTIGSLANAGTATLTVVATVNATGTYANTATITGNETDPVSLNNTATSTPVPVPQTDLAVTKTVDNATPNVGSNVTFTITASNNGPSGATGVSVADALPSGYTLVSATPSVGTYTAPNWTIGSLANAGTATLTVVATVNPTGSYANTATISGNETDPVSLNNTATSTPVPVPQTDLAVTKTVSNATPNVGSNVTFTITASNNGPSGATGVSVADALPSGYTLVSATPSVGTYTAPNWTVGSLANAGTATLTVVATVNATGTYANTATITGNETDPVSLNNTATSTPVPVAQTDLAVTKTVNNTTPNVGSNVTFTITASNNGPSGATGVSVADALPSGYTLVSATPSVGTYTAPNWTVGSLANAGTATLTVVATVNATGTYANTATITGNETDPVSLNNTATSTPVPVAQTDLAVTKTVNNTTPNVGSNVTFTITASNNGPSGATGVSVADALPSGYTLVSATPSVGTYTAPNWTVGSLANAGTATLTVVATVNATGTYANTATITGNETDPVSLNNTATSTPVPVAQTDLAVTKTVNNTTPNVGSNVTFTITASNNGPSGATGVSVADALPSGYTLVSATPSVGTYTAPNWTVGSLANAGTATLTVVATVNATGTYANTATISGNETDPTPLNNTATSTPVPVAQTDLAVTKTVNNATPNVGSNVTFTITASNNGPSGATGVSVADALPSGYTLVSATPSVGTYTAPNWTVGSLANAGTATLTVVATVNATGTYANTATISGNETDPTPLNNTATSTPVPVAQTDLAVTKTVNNATPNVGSNVTFTITASNNGPSGATGVSVADALPSGYTLVSVTPSVGTYTAPNWTVGSLANVGTATLTVVATVVATGTYANTATISGNETDPTPLNNTATSTPVPVPQTDLAVTKTVDNATPNVGSNVTFTITASNNGPSGATGVSVADALPSGYTLVSATPSVGTYTAPNWTVGSLANASTATLTVVATVNATGIYGNTATISGNETDPVSLNNTATSTPVPVPQTDLAVTKTVDNATPNVGSNVTFTITASNNGPSGATGVSVADALPSGYTLVSATPSVGTYTAPNWTVGSLANAGTATLTVVATVNATGTYANTATITGNETDPVSLNNTATSTPVPVAQTDLAVTKTVNNTTPNVGSNVTFTITASNNGPSGATGVSVADALPSGYTLVSATPSVGTYTAPNWTVGSLANAGTATLTVVATVNATGTYANTATISGNETDPTPLNNTATSTPVPVAQTDLAVTKTVDNATPNVGSNVTFTITASNNGPSGATGVSVADALPSGYTLVSATPSVGTYTAPNWTVGSLANAGTATLTVVATVNATGTYANTATISGNETDPIPLNNTATSTPVPVAQTDLAVTKTVNNTTPNVGSNVTFTITASNNGPSGATGVSVADALPSGYTLVSATPSVGTYTAPNWTIGSLANAGSATLTVVATVNATGTYANTATITGNETDPVSLNNTATSTPVPVAQTDLAVTKTVSNATPNVGSNVTFTITASNNGPSGATGVSVADALPSGYTLVSATPSVGTYTAPNWTVGSLANAGTATLTVVATVNATGTYANTATISGNETDPTPLNNTATSTPVPVPQTDLAVTKTVDNATPNVGSNVTFTITASNSGPSGATGVVVKEALPSGYTLVSATPSVGTYTAPNWTIGSLANAGSATLTVVATVNATGVYANTVTIKGNEPDPTPSDTIATSTPVPVAQTDLAVTKTVSNATPNVGSNVTFTITASNSGPSGATGVVVKEALPSGYTLVSATPSVGTYTAPNWTIGSLANAGSATLTVVATVNATGVYANTVTIKGNEPDPTPSDTIATSTPVPVAQTDLAVTKTVSNATPNVGSNVTFTITASNSGPSGATGVVVKEALPSGYTLVSATPSVGTYTAPNWTVGSLANAGSATLTVVATVNATGVYANTVTIKGNEPDPTPSDTIATSTPVPVAQTDLAVTKTVSNATPNVGSNVTFTITASNSGPSGATGVVVKEALPSGYTLVSATPSVGTYTAPNWTVGSLANAGSATLTVVATVNATGVYANTVIIKGNEPDPTPSDTIATSTPVPVAQTDLAVTKTVSNATPNVGSNVTFTITASNSGPSGATGVVVKEALPSGYTLVSATPSVGTYTAPNWTIGSLANAGSATLTVVATVNATGVYANTVTIKGNEPDPTPSDTIATSTPVPFQFPIAVNDTSINNVPGVNAVLNIVTNDTLADGNPATALEVMVDIDPSTPVLDNTLTVPGQGVWTYTPATGSLTFNPETGFTTDPTDITYILTETATGLVDTALVNVEYIESAPIANSDNELNVQPQTVRTINVIANDNVSDNSPALAALVDVDLEPTFAGIQTSLLVPGEGTYNYNALTGNLTFTPIPGFYANPTPLVYALVEKHTGLSDTATVRITYLLSPSLELIKTGSVMGLGYLGDSILYSFTVINTGNVPVTGIVINDAKISASPIALTPGSLAPGGTGVAQAKYAIQAIDITAGEVINTAIASGTAANAVVVTDTSDNGDPAQLGGSNPTSLNLPPPPIVDVKLTSTTIGSCGHMIGDTVSFLIKVFREDTLNTSVSVGVQDSLGTNFELLSTSVSEGSYNGLTGEWSGISLAKGDTATLTLSLRILTNVGGLTCFDAWVDSLSLQDVDSSPGDKVVTEDDIARSCVSVPISICPSNGETVILSAELGHATYQWYRNGVLLVGATNPSLTVTQNGSYTTVVDGNSCPNGNCCPIDVQENCPCPVTLCIPITITKTN